MPQGQKTILAIEDNEDIRQLIALILEDAGFAVLTCANGSDGLTLARSEHPDLILLDFMMPGMNGLEVLSELRQDLDPRIQAIPVLMLTAKSADEDRDGALAKGATAYLLKPFKPEKLVEEVLSIFNAVKLRPQYEPESMG